MEYDCLASSSALPCAAFARRRKPTDAACCVGSSRSAGTAFGIRHCWPRRGLQLWCLTFELSSTYEINAKELRGRPLHEAHVIYCIWLDQGKPSINSAFLQAVRDKLQSRPKAKWLPSFLQRKAEADRKGNPRFAEEQVWQMRRSIKKAQNVCIAVSKGKFPS